MNRSLFCILLLIFFSCKKNSENIIWEKSFGSGNAMFIKASPDSGIVCCGESEGKGYFLYLDKNRNKIAEYRSADNGCLTSALYSKDCFITAGNREGKMLLMRLDNQANVLWDTTFSTTYYINRTSMSYIGGGEILAAGSVNPDSSDTGDSGLFFVWFDTTGTVSNHTEIKEASFISVNDLITDNTGNIYLAMTTKSAAAKPKAGVAKYNNLLQKIWEKDLYNNPEFGAASLGIKMDNTGNIYVAGKTELQVTGGIVNNSFLVSLTGNGGIRWKKYLESTNAGSSVAVDGSGRPVLLNMNCFIINILNPDDGSSSGIIRTYNGCDSRNTDTFGLCIDIDWNGDILMAGSKGGGFYLALKSSHAESPV